MADQEYLNILNQGADVWNRWKREVDTDGAPNLDGVNLFGADLVGINFWKAGLRGANLSNANLSHANLSQAILTGAKLTEARAWEANLYQTDLSEANLSRAHLQHADISEAGLINANLSGTDLSWANFSSTDLSGADLSGADLREVNFSEAILDGVNLEQARLWRTIFVDVDLSMARGLESMQHAGPSYIGIDTIYRSKGNIPEIFLRGAGVPDSFIEYMRSLIGKPIDFYSSFISYSSKDKAFANRLYADLQNKGVRCWFAPHDLKWGEKIRTGIDEAIHFHDKLLLILSKHSVASGWVEHEVKTALAKERREKRTVLFPIRLDKAILDSPLAWATTIRHERNMGDFTKWKNHDDYQKAFDHLLRDLKAV